MTNLENKLIAFIMSDWQWSPQNGPECKFCGAAFRNPKKEFHYSTCPRLEWAIANDDTPKRRTERACGREFPSWGDDYARLKGERLTSEGRALLALLAEAQQ